jgi:hypothetical protein
MQASQLCDTLIPGWKSRLGFCDARTYPRIIALAVMLVGVTDRTGGRHSPDPGVSGCCALTANGNAAAAPPSSVMKSRRFNFAIIRLPRRRA